MNEAELKNRTKVFTLRIVKLVGSLPRSIATEVIGKQLMKSGSSPGANYRAACRSRSRREFLSKITVVEEEADEAAYWLEVLSESKLVAATKLRGLLEEAYELTAIFTAIGKTTRKSLEP